MNKISGVVIGTLMAGALGFMAPANAGENIKIGFIDGLSGPFAAVGATGIAHFKYAADHFANDAGGLLDGRKLEIIAFDNKTSPKESLIQLKNAIGQGVQIILQGNSSGVANALTDAVRKHNKRNPDKRVLFLNYSAVDPALTNAKCNFWHFRFDANADMKMNAITDVIAKKEEIKKIYLIGQDYSFGKAVAAAAVKFLGEKRPDIEIVGNELHPIGKVKDFSPYMAKIKASGADAIITGNWGADMVNLSSASEAAGLDLPYYTYYAAGTGITAAIGKGGVGRIRVVSEGHTNPSPTVAWDDYTVAFKKKNPKTDLTTPRIAHTIQMLTNAIKAAGSADPYKIALALEEMEITTIAGDKMVMRKSDHQLQMPIQISVHSDQNIKWDYDKSGFGLLTESSVPLEGNALETSCKMERPES